MTTRENPRDIAEQVVEEAQLLREQNERLLKDSRELLDETRARGRRDVSKDD